MSWNNHPSSSGRGRPAARDRTGWNAQPSPSPRVQRPNPWFLLKSLPALFFAARLAAGRERRDRGAAVLRDAERNLATIGLQEDVQRVVHWLGLLLDELTAIEGRGVTRWTPQRDGAPGRLAAEVGASDPTGNPGASAVLRACLLLSRTGQAGTISGRMGPDLFDARRDPIETAPNLLILIGAAGAGKSNLVQASESRFTPARPKKGEADVHQRWSAGALAVEEKRTAHQSPISPDNATIVVQDVSGSEPLVTPDAPSVLVVTKVDQVPGCEIFFGGIDEHRRDSPCGLWAPAGEPTATAFAGAIADHLLGRLAAVEDARRRIDLLGFGTRLASVCEQIALTERGGARPWQGVFLTAAPPDEPAWFVRELWKVLLPQSEKARPSLSRVLLVAAASAITLLVGASFLLTETSTEDAGGSKARNASAPPLREPDPVQPQATGPAVSLDPVAPAAERQAAPGPFSFPGEPARSYAALVQPACQAATEGLFPFFGDSAQDASPGEVRRLFGPGGMLPSFVDAKLQTLLAKDGPVWRWRPEPATQGFDPATPETLAKLPELAESIGAELEIGIEAVEFSGGVTGAELKWKETSLTFGRPGETRMLKWQLLTQPTDAGLVLWKGDRPVQRYQQGGPWSLFRLIQQGRSESSPDGSTVATFSDGAHAVTFRLRVGGGGQPFGRGGTWSFRCPPAL